jgi:hypothetical protein
MKNGSFQIMAACKRLAGMENEEKCTRKSIHMMLK